MTVRSSAMASSATKATIYLDRTLHRAAKVKAAATGRSLSAIMEEALRVSLAEDAVDLVAVRARRREPTRSFEDVLRDLRRDGLL